MAADYYKELGVGRDVTSDELKKAYRKLAAELHPDKNPGNAAAEARFKAVNRAYQALYDKKKRALYDEFGEAGLSEGFNADATRAYRRAGARAGGTESPFNPEDIFSDATGSPFADIMGDLFGGRGGGRRRTSRRGSDVASEVTVDFAAAVRGASISVRLQPNAAPVTVRIPPGADDGDRVRVAGHGAPGVAGGPPGDLVISVRVRSHTHFRREGLDLHLDLPVSVGEAFRGAKVRVPTPDGEVSLKVPKHAQSGQTVRLKGRGVKRQGDVGDLFVRFLVQLPDKETAEVEQAIETLERASGGSVRDAIAF